MDAKMTTNNPENKTSYDRHSDQNIGDDDGIPL